MQEALSQQVNAELYSAYLYLSMAVHCETENLSGFAHWLRLQYQEETGHGLKILDYILERGSKAELGAIEGPPTSWESPKAVFQNVFEHEQHVTGLINKLVDLAIEESDHATNNFLQWFVAEQVEEEATADGILQKLNLIGDAPGGLFMLDRELGQRAPGPPGEGG
jgi:ferritin